jgi:hypothetical protein
MTAKNAPASRIMWQTTRTQCDSSTNMISKRNGNIFNKDIIATLQAERGIYCAGL